MVPRVKLSPPLHTDTFTISLQTTATKALFCLINAFVRSSVCVCVKDTGHVNHPAIAVLDQVSRLAVNSAGSDAVTAEEVRVHRCGLAVAPRWGQVRQLKEREKIKTLFSLKVLKKILPCLCDDNAVI